MTAVADIVGSGQWAVGGGQGHFSAHCPMPLPTNRKCYPAWIRTRTKRAKISCATVTLRGSGEVGAVAFVPLRTSCTGEADATGRNARDSSRRRRLIDVSLRGLPWAIGRCNSCRRHSLKHESPETARPPNRKIRQRRPVTSTHPATRRASRRTLPQWERNYPKAMNGCVKAGGN